MKYILLYLFMFLSISLHSQSLELIGGISKNVFFDNEDDFSSGSQYTSEPEKHLRFAIDDIRLDSIKLRLTITYQSYNGNVSASSGGMLGGVSVTANVEKSLVSLGIFPANFTFFDHLDFNAGIEYSRLVNNITIGCRKLSNINDPSLNFTEPLLGGEFNAKNYLGFRGRLAYHINITSNISISPQYSYYVSMSEEFKDFLVSTKSMRHYFSIGIRLR